MKKFILAFLIVLLAYKWYRVIHFDAQYKDGVYEKISDLPEITLDQSNQVNVLQQKVQVITEPKITRSSKNFCLVILSAPKNFENRLLTRNFLKTSILNLEVKYQWFFVLGQTNSSEIQVCFHIFTEN